jgi:hypothetical protein
MFPVVGLDYVIIFYIRLIPKLSRSFFKKFSKNQLTGEPICFKFAS